MEVKGDMRFQGWEGLGRRILRSQEVCGKDNNWRAPGRPPCALAFAQSRVGFVQDKQEYPLEKGYIMLHRVTDEIRSDDNGHVKLRRNPVCCPAAFGEAGTAFQLTALPTHHLFRGSILVGFNSHTTYVHGRNKTILHLTNVVQLLNDDVAHSHADGLHACCIDLIPNARLCSETVKAEVDKDIVIRTLCHYNTKFETTMDHEYAMVRINLEFGQSEINVTDNMKDECLPKMTAQPDARIGKRIVAGQLYSRYFAREDNELGSETRVLTSETNLLRSPTRSRLRSLDIFRGAAIAMMIFVNSGGGGYAVFTHTVWNGLTIADVVFPCFAFAMGEALVLSLNARLRTAMSRTTALVQACLIRNHQRLEAVAGYFHIGCYSGVEAPGCPVGYLGPGGLHLSASGKNLQNCTGGIAGYIDSCGWESLMKNVTLGNVTMSHQTGEEPAECLASLSHSTMIGLRAALEISA
ncbi:Heparan-alpha-glucosaminide N-acetyltransferase [Eumeta japonica]|uniref:Heparan-alpha-glucosaminide N-acetyltransferase n=1 Tax=Eumeta variegata TaxID=151549 RepID=A0A4C2A4T8_EUMVA|nr:Heparan-alpha-glucosaminide N-acetyltransferase [Eumeta japonica]